ncbi:Hypothetical protein FKW44_019578 [Caligus rogercresseyi]|uniref:Uncharacterized protein n=1 Tax=Caligus rogercresseyi TaxID=217165 RepID=A0A7T8GW16_CALRO|nr:Hypothetical protein FKW44_019578 [Caligus rogercresseyi]
MQQVLKLLPIGQDPLHSEPDAARASTQVIDSSQHSNSSSQRRGPFLFRRRT